MPLKSDAPARLANACCRAGALICSTPRRSISKSRILPTASPALRAGTGRTIGDHPFSVAQHSLIVEMVMRQKYPTLPVEALMMGLLHDGAEYVVWRHDLSIQVRNRS